MVSINHVLQLLPVSSNISSWTPGSWPLRNPSDCTRLWKSRELSRLTRPLTKVIHAVSNYWGEDSWRAACELGTQLSEFLTHTKCALLVMQLPLRHPRFCKSPQQTQTDQAGLGWSHFFGALSEVNRYFLTASQERPQHASLAYKKVEFSALHKILPT